MIRRLKMAKDGSVKLIRDVPPKLESLEIGLAQLEKHAGEILARYEKGYGDSMRRFKYVNPELAILPTTDKKKVLICGFFGGDNLGDELMLKTVLEYINTEAEDTQITVMLADNPEYDILDFYNIRFIHYPQSAYDYELLSEYFDKVIFAGGALIDDRDYGTNYGGEMSLSTTLIELSVRSIKKGKQCFWLGLSCNESLHNERFLNKLGFIADNIDYISFRDTYSIATVKAAGVGTDRIELVNDLIMAGHSLADISTAANGEGIKSIGVIPICLEHNFAKNRAVLECLLDKTEDMGGVKINLIPFYNYQKADVRHCEKLRAALNNERINVLDFGSSWKHVNRTISEQDCIISARYHGALLALIFNKPLLTIEYDIHPHYKNKIAYIYDRYTAERNVIRFSDIEKEELGIKIEALLGQIPENFDKSFLRSTSEWLENIIKTIDI